MTSFYAKPIAQPSSSADEPKTVLFVIYPNIVLLDLVGPLQVFTHALRTPTSRPAYRTHVASLAGGATKTNTILKVESERLEAWVDAHRDKPIHTLVVVGGDGAIAASMEAGFVRLLRVIADRATRVCSVCSGALVLAAAGLLDGRRATTHWEDCHWLATQYPEVQVEEDPIFVKDGHIWTSAGITAGIDMALAIIEEDLGKPAAIAMARSLVTPMVRSGGQSQFSAELDRQSRDAEGRFSGVHAWIAANLHRTITVDDMAAAAGMSGRNFSRRYTEVMGASPARALAAIRVDAARDLLATTDKSVKSIARSCGFQDDERMRRAFLNAINTTPSEYRRQFQIE